MTKKILIISVAAILFFFIFSTDIVKAGDRFLGSRPVGGWCMNGNEQRDEMYAIGDGIMDSGGVLYAWWGWWHGRNSGAQFVSKNGGYFTGPAGGDSLQIVHGCDWVCANGNCWGRYNQTLGVWKSCVCQNPNNYYTYQVYQDTCGNWVCWGARCADTDWSPDPATVCSGQTFTQTSNCGSTRQAVGTKICCTDTSWSPDPATVCSGQTFTQTSNCGTTRQSTGTKSCPPVVVTPSVSTVQNPCVNPYYNFSWTYSDAAGDTDSQTRFQFQVDDNSDFSSLRVDRDITGLNNPSPTVNTQSVLLSLSDVLDKILYDTNYFWRVKVFDSGGENSGWVSGPDFTTAPNLYPLANFSWLPILPAVNEGVKFADQSTVYGSVTKSSWSWVFQNGIPSSSAEQNPSTKFFSAGNKLVILQMVDSNGCACQINKTVKVGGSFPGWKEIAP